jgi:tRNA G10  N-methylase Trm11
MQKYAFLLWREPFLSLAELESIFWNLLRAESFAIIETERETVDMYKNSLGGTIKVALIHNEWLKKNEILPLVIKKIAEKAQEGKKLRIAIDSFVPALNSLVFKAKDALKEQWYSIRVVQHDNGRTKTATTIHEKLIEQGIELIIYSDKSWFILAETIWIQDIESYSQRDMERDRSMTVGMMPPKIAQIMINMATRGDRNMIIWDPFCGLGTTLIEALHSGFTHLKWSDIEPKMTETTQKNIESQKGVISADIETFILDATQIDTHIIDKWTAIVTEWMLGKNFTSHTITQQLAFKERKELIDLYSWFLSSAYNNKNIKSLCCCLPFWNIGNETLYMPEISALSRDWTVATLCIRGKRYLSHMRPGQCVGREIILLTR